MKNKISYILDVLVLFIITLVLGVLLSFTKIITDEPISIASEKKLINSYKNVLNNYNSNDDITVRLNDDSLNKNAKLLSFLVAYDENKNQIGFLVLTRAVGYGGNVDVLVGFDNDGVIKGIEYPNNLQETPGIGMKIKNEDFKNKFLNHSIKDVQNVDTMTGATISSTAVKYAINVATDYVNFYLDTN